MLTVNWVRTSLQLRLKLWLILKEVKKNLLTESLCTKIMLKYAFWIKEFLFMNSMIKQTLTAALFMWSKLLFIFKITRKKSDFLLWILKIIILFLNNSEWNYMKLYLIITLRSSNLLLNDVSVDVSTTQFLNQSLMLNMNWNLQI